MIDEAMTPPNEDITAEQFMQVFGKSGTEFMDGKYFTDYKREWNDAERFKIVDEMKKGDSTIKGGLNLIKSPLLATEWTVQGGKEQHREYIDRNLNEMDRTFKDFLYDSLTFLEYGFSLSEIILDVVDGEIRLKDLAPRLQKSIYSFETKDKQAGVTQMLMNGETTSIPYSKLLWFVNDREGDDMSGVPIVRSAWGAWYNKTIIQKIANIACERYGVGVPWLSMPGNIDNQKKNAATAMLKNIRSHENNYLITVGEGYNLQILTPTGNPQGQMIMELIAYYDRRILISLLSQGLDLGSQTSGSYALAEEQKADLLVFAEEKAKYIEDLVSQKVIKLLIDLQFGEQEEYPYLAHEPLGKLNQEKYSNALSTLVNAGLIVSTPEVKKYMHNLFELPSINDEDIPKDAEEELKELEAKLKFYEN